MSTGTILRIWVKPKSSKAVFPLNVSKDIVEASVISPPNKGKANKELIALISDFFNVPKSQISIVGGMKSREKIVRIEGIDETEVMEKLFSKKHRTTG